MRKCVLAAWLLAGGLALGGCTFNETLVVVLDNPLTQEAITQGVAAGVEYGDAELGLGLGEQTKADLSAKVAEKVVTELREAATTSGDGE